MKFRFVKKVQGRVKAYQGQTVATGEEVEFTGPFVEKAKRNPNYELVSEGAQPGSKKKASKKRASKKKVTHG